MTPLGPLPWIGLNNVSNFQDVYDTLICRYLIDITRNVILTSRGQLLIQIAIGFMYIPTRDRI